MKFGKPVSTFTIMLGLVAAPLGYADTSGIDIIDPVFEINLGFNNANCISGSCSIWSVGAPIPDWNSSAFYGQGFITGYDGSPPAFDCNFLAYNEGGRIWQNVGDALDAGKTLTILLSSAGQQADIDNVRPDNLTAVLLPSAVWMFLAGFVGLLALKRRK
ncbi:MAG: hypothetical protein ABSB19_15635 [Methylomonas sp.]|jgi:hypothetical protein